MGILRGDRRCTRRWAGCCPTQHRVSHPMWVATRLHYCVKKLWIARICVANCCGSYVAGFSTDRESVSIAFLMASSFSNDLPFFCATGTNVWIAMKACSATRNPAPAMAALSPAMLRNSVPANGGSIFCAIILAKRASTVCAARFAAAAICAGSLAPTFAINMLILFNSCSSVARLSGAVTCTN